MFAWKRSNLFKLVARILVFLMAIQGWPWWELSHEYQWEYRPEKLERILDLLSFLGPAPAEAYETVSGSVSGTWTTGNTYYASGGIRVDTGYTLTIEPGVVVKFPLGASLEVRGTLNAAGTEGAPIYFTSRDDDTVGEIIAESDGEPTPMSWECIDQWGDGSDDTLSRCVIRYGRYGVRCFNSNLVISNCTVEQCSWSGVYARDVYTDSSAPTISGGIIRNNGIGVIYSESSGIDLINCPATIENVQIIQNNGCGIYCMDSSPRIINNTITGNIYPIGATGHLSFTELSGNTISGNTINTAIAIFGAVHGTIYDEEHLDAGLRTYVLTHTYFIYEGKNWGGGGIVVESGTTLTIEPGAVIKSIAF